MTDPRLPNLHNRTDPRRPGGDIVGPGDPRTQHGVLVSAENAVILSFNEVTLIEVGRGDEREAAVAMVLEGRINRTTETSRILYITNGDGAAALVTQLLGLAKRAERDGDTRLADEFRQRLGERWDEMPK